MSIQVIRVEGYTKGSLGTIGRECDRADVNHRNTEIDKGRSYLNHSYKEASQGFATEYADIKAALNAQGKETKKGIAFEGMIITADLPFFERLGYKQGEPMTKEVKAFFDDAYSFAKEQIGYQSTDKNILSAKVHMDEKTPHLHLYYLPITEKWQEKVYAKGENGKVLRTEKGTPIQAKDEKGKTIYKQVENTESPKLARSEFWRVRGGQYSYRQMQDCFHENVGKKYSLERGEIGSDREYKRTAQFKAEQIKQEIKPYKELRKGMERVETPGTTVLPGVVVIKKKSLDALKEKAKAYTANRKEIVNVRKNSQAVKKRDAAADQREQKLDDLEKAIEIRQQAVNEMYQRQTSINQVLERTEKERDGFKGQLTDQQSENADLRGENATLRDSIENLRAEHIQTVDGLTERLRGAYESLSATVKAVGMLKWDKEDGYKVDNLTKKQDRLIDGIGNYGANWAREDGFLDLAEEMQKHIGISNGIAKEIKALEPSRSHGLEL